MSLRQFDIQAYVKQFNVELPPIEDFWRLGDLTALRYKDKEGFVRSNYERGILLYTLVAHYRPQHILEFGTGRGYGALCMAWSMAKHNIDGKIITIDTTSPDTPIDWAIDWHDDAGPMIQSLARNEVWAKAAPDTWLDKIEQRSGDTRDVMSQYEAKNVEMAFIDAGHHLSAARHDFYSVLTTGADKFGILFDDYNPKFGVKNLIDKEIISKFDASLIYTDRRWNSAENPDIDYGMLWVHTDNLLKPLEKSYNFRRIGNFLHAYRSRKTTSPRWKMLAYKTLQKMGLR